MLISWHKMWHIYIVFLKKYIEAIVSESKSKALHWIRWHSVLRCLSKNLKSQESLFTNCVNQKANTLNFHQKESYHIQKPILWKSFLDLIWILLLCVLALKGSQLFRLLVTICWRSSNIWSNYPYKGWPSKKNSRIT